MSYDVGLGEGIAVGRAGAEEIRCGGRPPMSYDVGLGEGIAVGRAGALPGLGLSHDFYLALCYTMNFGQNHLL